MIKINNNLKNLYIHRSLMILASSFFGIFGTIFLYHLMDDNFIKFVSFSLAGSLSYFLLLPFLKYFINFKGFKFAIFTGTIINILFLSSYWATSYFVLNWGWMLIMFFLVFIRFAYWVPMHTELTEASEDKNRGTVISTIRIITNTIGIITPILSGFIISKYGFHYTFFVGVLISLFAIFPIFYLKEKRKKEVSWNVKKVYKEFFNKKNRKFTLANFAMGLENSVAVVVWPIFIFELLQGNLLKIGILSTAITVFVILLNFLQGKLSSKKGFRKKMMKYGTYFYSASWFFRIFATTALYVFVVDIYQKITKDFSFISFDAFVYDYTADQGSLVDEYTILKEMSLHIGKVIGYIIIIILSLYVSLNYIFILALIASLGINIIPTENYLEKKED